MISHDLGLIANVCARVGVMYAGRLVEMRAAQDVFRSPSHPYTRGLVASLPLFGARAANGRSRLKEISGVVPAVTSFPDGCRFNPRCYARTEICVAQDPDETALAHGGTVRCHHHA
jgi:peptide/nickel transport system ATP-binding protein